MNEPDRPASTRDRRIAAEQLARRRHDRRILAFVDEGSCAAANAMACAAETGFGPACYGGLFANHTLARGDRQLNDLAGGVTGGQVSDGFARCVETRKHADWIDSLNAGANAQGVTSTPSMFVGDQPVDITILPPERLNQLIAAEPQK